MLLLCSSVKQPDIASNIALLIPVEPCSHILSVYNIQPESGCSNMDHPHVASLLAALNLWLGRLHGCRVHMETLCKVHYMKLNP